jgi:hypothetical protein
MGTGIFETHCFLCGASARGRETDHGNRRQFWCTNPKCGEYEISHTAMGRLDTSPDFKARASDAASRVHDRDKIYEVTFDSKAGCVNGEVVTRRSELR